MITKLEALRLLVQASQGPLLYSIVGLACVVTQASIEEKVLALRVTYLDGLVLDEHLTIA